MRYIIIIFLFISLTLSGKDKIPVKPANVSTKVRSVHNVYFKGYKVKKWDKVIIKNSTYYIATMQKKSKGYITAVYLYGYNKKGVYARLKNWQSL